MAIFDGRLIDPDETQLARALGRAMKSANGGKHQTNRMTRDADFWGRFARDVLRGGPEGRRRSCKGGRDVPEVVTGWWTDPAGRKHIRVIGRTRQRWGGPRLRRETDMRELPPWWHVYPEAVLGVRLKKEGERYLAVCRCGACGAPESLGWMGDTCGPCFDRRADGGTASGGFGQFTGWSPRMSRFGFTADGQYLVSQNTTSGFWKVHRDTGAAVSARRKTVNYLMAVGADVNGVTLVSQEGSVYRWADGADDVEIAVPTRRTWGRVTMTPDGRFAALISYQDAYTVDLTQPSPRWTRQTPPEAYAIQYAPDGSRLLATTGTGELRAIDPSTMAFEVLRADLFEGHPTGSGSQPEFVVSPDGAAVLVRREWYYPRRVSVRRVPLPAGKMTELRVPEWHRATSMAFSPDGKFAVTAESEGGWVGFFDLSSGKALGFVRAVLEDLSGGRSGQIEFAPDGGALAVSYNTGHSDHGATIAVWPWPDAMLAAATPSG